MNQINQEITNKVVELFLKEVIPAEGCTEPIAIAYATAKATEVLACKPEHINVTISSNIIKNVKSVIVPNSGGMIGIEVAAAMGAYAGDATKQLLVISNTTPAKLQQVKDFLQKKAIRVFKAENSLKLYVKIEVFAADNAVSVEIKNTHTNISEIIKNGSLLFSANQEPSSLAAEDPAKILNLRLIYDLAQTIDLNLIQERLDKVINCNTAIALEGLSGNYGVNSGKNIQNGIKLGFYGQDSRNRSASNAAAGSDARMGGSAMPVMTTAGSGNVGLTASLPIITYCQDKKVPAELMYRALFFSIMATIHIKSRIGRLSAYCGPQCAAGAVAGALGFANGADYSIITNAITNTLAGVSGVVCDGANSSCAIKIANGTYAAYDGIMLAMNGNVVTPGDGIVADDIETTIDNIGELARRGMQQTDDVVLEIMTRH